MAITNGTRALFTLGKIYGLINLKDLESDWVLKVTRHCSLEEVAFMESLFDQHLVDASASESEIQLASRKILCAFAARRKEFHL